MTVALISVGPKGEELYRQGKCRVCGIACFGFKPIERDICGWCEAMQQRAKERDER